MDTEWIGTTEIAEQHQIKRDVILRAATSGWIGPVPAPPITGGGPGRVCRISRSDFARFLQLRERWRETYCTRTEALDMLRFHVDAPAKPLGKRRLQRALKRGHLFRVAPPPEIEFRGFTNRVCNRFNVREEVRLWRLAIDRVLLGIAERTEAEGWCEELGLWLPRYPLIAEEPFANAMTAESLEIRTRVPPRPDRPPPRASF